MDCWSCPPRLVKVTFPNCLVGVINLPVILYDLHLCNHFPPPTSKFPGWMIGITLSFPNKLTRLTDTYPRKAKENIEIFLCSIYHLHEIDKQKELLDELNQFITNWPRNLEILMGAYINCNVGVTSKRFSNTLGPHGIDNINIKEKRVTIFI